MDFLSTAQDPATVDADWACARYETLRHLLPQADFPARSAHVADLSAMFERFDGFILDAYGVLNVGAQAIPGAVARIAQMRAAGKAVVVLTNGAAHARRTALAKYASLGFDFTAAEVVASRDVAAERLAQAGPDFLWAAIAGPGAGFDDLPVRVTPLLGNDGLLERADGFVFLGSDGWSAARNAALSAALCARPRPVIIANPDIVAPNEDGFSLEPGHFAADLPGRSEYFGKPHGPAFEAACARITAQHPIPRHRIAMVGDTLHTDVLGGRAAGFGTVLIAGHGLFRGHDPARFIAASGIVPDVIAQTT